MVVQGPSPGVENAEEAGDIAADKSFIPGQLEFIASITQHFPEPSFQLVRYYGWYSNRMRGDRKKQEERN